MKYTGNIYRPPYEANSLLLQLTTGCSHNKCSFCTMYKDIPFEVESMEQIEKDLLEARRMYSSVERIFLLNGDAFSLSFNKLKALGMKIHEIFPEIKTIAAYASVNSIKMKTDDELKELRYLKFNDFNIGVESGMNEVLVNLNKGYDLNEARTQLLRLKSAGIRFCTNIVIGSGGTEKSFENAVRSAELMNEVQPWMIFLTTLFIDPSSRLYEDVRAGRFEENSAGQNLFEEIEFIRRLELKDTYFFGLHTSNAVQVGGRLPMDKEKILKSLEDGKKSFDISFLEKRPRRGHEGLHINE